jgi:hypothetical protein
VRITVPYEVGLRLTRADQELVALQDEVRSYLGREPYASGFEADPKYADRSRIVIRIKEPIPEQIPIRLSECIHHWRASLDNFAYIISRRHSGHTSGSEFPIFLDPVVFAERQKNGLPGRRSGLYKIRGMKPSAQTVIERLQPYSGGQANDPLWMLHELSNADKHRLFHAMGSVLEGSTNCVRHVDPGVVIKKIRFIFGPVEDNATIGYIYRDKRDPDANMTVTFNLTYRVAFGDRADDAGQPLPTTVSSSTSRPR